MPKHRHLVRAVACLAATTSFAVVPPDDSEPLRQKAFEHRELWWESVYRPVAELPVDAARSLGRELARLGADPGDAYFDVRTGRWGTLVVTRPLIPGPGVGNTLRWSDLGVSAPSTAADREQAVWDAFRGYLSANAAQLRIDPAELGPPRVTTRGERLIHIHVGREIGGVAVRRAFVQATVHSGNLILFGTRNWGEAALDTRPRLSAVAAESVLREHLGRHVPSGFRDTPELTIVPVSEQPDQEQVELAAGLRYRLAWVLRPMFATGLGSWEALVDAHSGELLALRDTNHYASRRVEGWVFPMRNDGEGDEGTLQPGFPMPFADVALDGVPLGFSTSGGNAPPGADTGTLSTTLSGQYIHLNDGCGAIDESASVGDLDLEGVPGGADCDVPPDHSAGDTNAARTVFYELNRLTEQARGYLSDNSWLGQPLTVNVDFEPDCGAFWNGSTVNLFRSGADLDCPNTGEIAGIFDHEWAHGLDDNDGNPTISEPGEGIADVYTQNRLVESCIGRGFSPDLNCHGYGDPCTDCNGVRDTDWAKRASGEPHDIDFILASCPTGFGGPCGRITHCEGAVVGEAVWDLVHRDLMGFDGSPFDLDLNTALEMGTRLTYLGASNVGDWYQCAADGTGGCNADSGYLGYLAADDDNGDLTDGTPHMAAIFAAFDRHQIACPTPAVQTSGCAGAPTVAPANVTATPLDDGVQLAWDAVAGATEYRIYRTEGVRGCDFGKAIVGTTTDIMFEETGLGSGFEVLYSVAAVGASDACSGPLSPCVSITPGAALEFAPSSLDFGDVTVGETSAPQPATLTNTGDVEATEISFSLPPDSGFRFDAGDCGPTLPSAGSCEVSVTFAPTELGAAAADLAVISDESSSASLGLAGNGVEPTAFFGAVGLAADPHPRPAFSDGNGVFEPDEIVAVAPTWRNDGVLPHTLTGTASSFTGPAGAAYVVEQDAADYGPVATGDSASCLGEADCYLMGVSDPAVRPQAHWDAAFDESLSEGSARTWTLHIGDSFGDVARASLFYTPIETLLHNDVTGGCATGLYCPNGTSSRAQMAVFVLKAKEGPEYVPPACTEEDQVFGDVPFDHPFCPWIEELFNRGVVAGCGGGDYCPGATVDRAQMAVFLLKTFEGSGYAPPECGGIFEDVTCPSTFADWIEELYNRGVTGGCGTDPLSYCPSTPVNRQQMAAFLTKTFLLELYGP